MSRRLWDDEKLNHHWWHRLWKVGTWLAAPCYSDDIHGRSAKIPAKKLPPHLSSCRRSKAMASENAIMPAVWLWPYVVVAGNWGLLRRFYTSKDHEWTQRVPAREFERFPPRQEMPPGDGGHRCRPSGGETGEEGGRKGYKGLGTKQGITRLVSKEFVHPYQAERSCNGELRTTLTKSSILR